MTEWPERTDGLDINAVTDGYVVYDRARDRVHYLNNTAALVLEFCTGDNSAAEIVEMFQLAYDLPEAPVAEVQQCLELLLHEGLIS
jgi:hypothetical protein